MNIEGKIKDCEYNLKQIIYFNPDPFYVNYFFTGRSDVFALGAILRFLAKTSTSERAPKRLVAIAEKAMSEAPSERYQTAELLEQDVKRFIGGQRVMAYDDTPIEKLVQFAQRHRVPITLIVAYLLLRILLIIFNRT